MPETIFRYCSFYQSNKAHERSTLPHGCGDTLIRFIYYQRRERSNALSWLCHLLHPPPQRGCFSARGLQDMGWAAKHNRLPSGNICWEPESGPGGAPNPCGERGAGRRDCKKRHVVAAALNQSSSPTFAMDYRWGNWGTKGQATSCHTWRGEELEWQAS